MIFRPSGFLPGEVFGEMFDLSEGEEIVRALGEETFKAERRVVDRPTGA